MGAEGGGEGPSPLPSETRQDSPALSVCERGGGGGEFAYAGDAGRAGGRRTERHGDEQVGSEVE